MTDDYLITYSGSKQDGFVPVVSGPVIGEPLLYLADGDGNYIRHDDPYKAEAHAGHYLCSVLNEAPPVAPELLTTAKEAASVLRRRKAIAYDRCARQLDALCDRAAIANPGINDTPGKVWVLHVSHRHGDNYGAFTSLEAARNALHAYVSDWWDDGLAEQYGALKKLSREAAIDAYFDAHGEALDPEFYALEKVTLDPGTS